MTTDSQTAALAIEATDLRKTYPPDVIALDGVNLSVLLALVLGADYKGGLGGTRAASAECYC